MEAYMWAIWLGVFVIALIVEGLTTEVVSVWFALGAVISMIISFIPGVAWWVQLIVFVVVSGATLACVRPFLSKLLKRSRVETNIDEIIGKLGVVILPYDELNNGEAKVGGTIWTVVNAKEKEPLSKDDIVEVIAVKGNKLIVKFKEKGGN